MPRPPDDSEEPAEALVGELAAGLCHRYVHNPAPLGMVPNWNAAVASTTGSHVVLLHQDDLLAPAALEVMSGAFADRPGLAICGVGETSIDDQSRAKTISRPNHRSHLFVSAGPHDVSYADLVYLMLCHGQIFGSPSALMFTRSHFDAIGGFDAEYRHSVDIDFALRMAEVGDAVYFPQELVRFRRHQGQTTQVNIANGHNLADRDRLYRRHATKAQLSPEQLDRVRACLVVRALYDALRAVRHGRWTVARQAGTQAIDLHPTPIAVGSRLVELARWSNEDAR